jgi:hypothetical protein
MSLTTDPKDPALGHGADESPVPQNEKYLVLSEDERSKGFVRPVRRAYRHVGEQPKYPLRDLTDEERERYAQFNYVRFEAYPASDEPVNGRYWTQAQLDKKGCGTVTTMGDALAETYAREPKFYGSTYCVTCQMHRPVGEFVWDGTDEVVGS